MSIRNERVTMRVTNRTVVAIALAACLTLPMQLKSSSDPTYPPVNTSTPISQLLPPLLTPVTNTITGLLSLLGKARDMKLLVISADGTDPGYSAIRALLDQMGVPYDAVVLTQTGGNLPPLESGSK